MKIILDTHIFLWALAEPDKLKLREREAIESPLNEIYVSAISIAEIMIKRSLGKLPDTFDPLKEADVCGFEILDFSGEAALLLGGLPFHHKDPFDRMLIAQSLALAIRIMTNDATFSRYQTRLF